MRKYANAEHGIWLERLAQLLAAAPRCLVAGKVPGVLLVAVDWAFGIRSGRTWCLRSLGLLCCLRSYLLLGAAL